MVTQKLIILVACLLMVPLTLGIASVADSKDVSSLKYQNKPGEVIGSMVKNVGTYFFSHPLIQSAEELDSYINRSKDRLNKLNSVREQAAIITFRSAVTQEELDQFVSRFDLHPISVRFKSKPDGAGQIPYPITSEILEVIQQNEDNLRLQFIQEKEKDSSIVVPEDFKIVGGYISITVKESVPHLKEINDSRILLIDVGPTDLLQNNWIDEAVPLKDIYFEYQEFH